MVHIQSLPAQRGSPYLVLFVEKHHNAGFQDGMAQRQAYSLSRKSSSEFDYSASNWVLACAFSLGLLVDVGRSDFEHSAGDGRPDGGSSRPISCCTIRGGQMASARRRVTETKPAPDDEEERSTEKLPG